MNKLAEIGITKQPSLGIQVGGKTTGELVGNLFKNTITLFFSVGAIAVVVMFLWGTVELILSGGDKEKVASAQKRITYSLIGLALLSLTFVIMAVIGQVLAIDLLGNFNIPSFNSDK